MFYVYVGSVGSGKTYSMVKAGKEAYERGETVYTNIDIDPIFWSDKKRGKIVKWSTPFELLDPKIRCGTVLWDELGASVNNREYEFWPLALTIKIIEHRKDHLDFHATVQNDELADKNIRRFYNSVYFCKEYKIPFLSLFFRGSKRPDLLCPNPDCQKGDKCLMKGDKGWWRGTFYSIKEVNPQDTQNKYKHRSKGTKRFCFDIAVANSYTSSEKTASNALAYYEKLKHAKRQYERPFFRRVHE